MISAILGKISKIYIRITGIVFGLFFLIVGLVLFINYDPDAYDMQTTATISYIKEEYDHSASSSELIHTVYIDYVADGIKYTDVELGSYNSSMKEGDQVEIYYMSEDPTQIVSGNKNFGKIFGLVAAFIGLISLIFTVLKIILNK